MKSRTCFLSIISVVVATIFLILFDIQTLVTETNKQIDNIKSFKDNLELSKQKKLVADEKYLKILGFVEKPRLYPHSVWRNSSLPIIVTSVQRNQVHHAVGFVRNIMTQLPNHSAVVYNLGLSSYDVKMLMKFCNSSRCFVIDFNYDLFPSHVSKLSLHAYRPVVIQDALNFAGAVLYMECDVRFSFGNITSLVNKSLQSGIILSEQEDISASNQKHAVTSLTHPKMFEYFQTVVDNFQFTPMMSVRTMLVYNTKAIHENVMLPWVQCALIQECIYPIGAQSDGCRFDKKPQYRYSGCHRYDESSLNVVLGLYFGVDNASLYSWDDSRTHIFSNVTDEVAEREYIILKNNMTGPL
ncbi:hypothetical protein M8J75_002825 [Diaphorina citri]|nr:hypothetical protein M8J75_002825 [Diaphorina citri]